MSYAVKAEDISKTYHITHQNRQSASLQEDVEHRLRRIAGWLGLGRILRVDDGQKELHETCEAYKALNDVSFEINHGQNLAIIGQNGAGKSTLLKILSRITEPNTGRVTLRGRVSSLLEVGTGFHPELTGRENIFLNGALLGMSRAEIKKKFDAIVDFSEIEQFIDTPVKYYSSGMYVRLAFSVAANLDPEILVLDEVLAVGDLRFQQKCLEKMQYVSKEGRTILFVSHNMQSVAQICPYTLFLEKGCVRSFGPTADAIKQYMGFSFASGDGDTVSGRAVPDSMAVFHPQERIGDTHAELIEASVRDEGGQIRGAHKISVPIGVEMHYRVLPACDRYLVPNFHIYNTENILVCVLSPKNDIISGHEPGVYMASCVIPPHLFNEGVFRVMLGLSSFLDHSAFIHFAVPYALTFEIKDDLSDLSYRNGYLQSIPGLIRPRFEWTVERTA